MVRGQVYGTAATLGQSVLISLNAQISVGPRPYDLATQKAQEKKIGLCQNKHIIRV